MAYRDVILSVGADFSQYEKDAQSFFGRRRNISNFEQPLGRITGKANEFTKSLEASNARVIAFGASAGVIYGLNRAFSLLVRSTIDVEKSLTDINSLLGLSGGELRKFSSELFKVASNTGSSFKDASKAANEFARQGLSVAETLKRTQDALILSRLAGVDFGEAVTNITAQVNAFRNEALSTTEVVNRLATVDARFAVSAADLAEALKRVGAAAEDSNVSFNETIALVTAAQQITARGGAVIGNAFKTIFTRLQRPQVLADLEAIGVSTKDAEGKMLPMVKILGNLASTYDRLSQSEKSFISENVASVYQINILKATLKDLSSGYSLYGQALTTAENATDSATKRNELLNTTISSKLIKTLNQLTQLGSQVGDLVIAPTIKGGLGSIDSLLSEMTKETGGEEVGNKIVEDLSKGFIKGLGVFLSGPGAQVLFKIVGSLFQKFSGFAASSLGDLSGLSRGATQINNLEQNALGFLNQRKDISYRLYRGEMTLVEAHRQYIQGLREEISLNRSRLGFAQQLAQLSLQQGVRSVSSSSRLSMSNPTGGSGIIIAGGYVPSFSLAEAERMGAKMGGYQAGPIKQMAIKGLGNITYNGNEEVKYVDGFSQPFINPPQNSKAGQKHRKNSLARLGIDPYSGGLVPNLAKMKFSELFGNVPNVDLSTFLGKMSPIHGEYSDNEIRGLAQRGGLIKSLKEIFQGLNRVPKSQLNAKAAEAAQGAKVASQLSLNASNIAALLQYSTGDDSLSTTTLDGVKYLYHMLHLKKGSPYSKSGNLDYDLKGNTEKAAYGLFRGLVTSAGGNNVDDTSIQASFRGARGIPGAIGSLSGSIYEAATSYLAGYKGSQVEKGQGDFDVRGAAGRGKLSSFFNIPNGVSLMDYKLPGNEGEFVKKILKEAKGNPNLFAGRFLQGGKAISSDQFFDARNKFGGMIPNLAYKKYRDEDGDIRRQITTPNGGYLNFQITEKGIKTGFIRSGKDKDKNPIKGEGYKMMGVLGRLAKRLQKPILSEDLARQAVEPNSLEGMSTEEKLNKLYPQLRYRNRPGWKTTASLLSGDINLKNVSLEDIPKSVPSNFQNKSLAIWDVKTMVSSGGLIPNLSALQSAIGREIKAGYSPSQVRVGRDGQLKSSFNPLGLGVYNTTEGSLSGAISLHRNGGKTNEQIKRAGAAGGLIPNFAGLENPSDAIFNSNVFASSIMGLTSVMLNGSMATKKYERQLEALRQQERGLMKQREDDVIAAKKDKDIINQSIAGLGLEKGRGNPTQQLAKRLQIQTNEQIVAQGEVNRLARIRGLRRTPVNQAKYELRLNAAQEELAKRIEASDKTREQLLNLPTTIKNAGAARKQYSDQKTRYEQEEKRQAALQEKLATQNAAREQRRQKYTQGGYIASTAISVGGGMASQAIFGSEASAKKTGFNLGMQGLQQGAQILSVIPNQFGLIAAGGVAMYSALKGIDKALFSTEEKFFNLAEKTTESTSKIVTSLDSYLQSFSQLQEAYTNGAVGAESVIKLQNQLSQSVLKLRTSGASSQTVEKIMMAVTPEKRQKAILEARQEQIGFQEQTQTAAIFSKFVEDNRKLFSPTSNAAFGSKEGQSQLNMLVGTVLSQTSKEERNAILQSKDLYSFGAKTRGKFGTITDVLSGTNEASKTAFLDKMKALIIEEQALEKANLSLTKKRSKEISQIESLNNALSLLERKLKSSRDEMKALYGLRISNVNSILNFRRSVSEGGQQGKLDSARRKVDNEEMFTSESGMLRARAGMDLIALRAKSESRYAESESKKRESLSNLITDALKSSSQDIPGGGKSQTYGQSLLDISNSITKFASSQLEQGMSAENLIKTLKNEKSVSNIVGDKYSKEAYALMTSIDATKIVEAIQTSKETNLNIQREEGQETRNILQKLSDDQQATILKANQTSFGGLSTLLDKGAFRDRTKDINKSFRDITSTSPLRQSRGAVGLSRYLQEDLGVNFNAGGDKASAAFRKIAQKGVQSQIEKQLDNEIRKMERLRTSGSKESRNLAEASLPLLRNRRAEAATIAGQQISASIKKGDISGSIDKFAMNSDEIKASLKSIDAVMGGISKGILGFPDEFSKLSKNANDSQKEIVNKFITALKISNEASIKKLESLTGLGMKDSTGGEIKNSINVIKGIIEKRYGEVSKTQTNETSDILIKSLNAQMPYTSRDQGVYSGVGNKNPYSPTRVDSGNRAGDIVVPINQGRDGYRAIKGAENAPAALSMIYQLMEKKQLNEVDVAALNDAVRLLDKSIRSDLKDTSVANKIAKVDINITMDNDKFFDQNQRNQIQQEIIDIVKGLNGIEPPKNK